MAFGKGWTNGFGEAVVVEAGLDLPCVTVEIGLGDDPFAPSPTWVPLEGVMGVTVEHSQVGQLDEYGPGTLSVSLDNTSGDFTPGDGDMLAPNQQIRVVAEHSTGNVVLFRGFVDDDPEVFYQRWTAQAEVSATNLVKLLSGVSLPPGDWPEERMSWRIERALDAVGVPSQWRQINDTPHHLCPAETIDGDVSVWDYLVGVARSEGGAVFVSKSGHVVFQERQSIRTDIYRRYPQATFSDDQAYAEGTRYSAPTWGRHGRMVRNRAVFSNLGGVKALHEDSASVVAFGARDLDQMADLKVRSAANAENLVEWNIGQWGQPHTFGPSLTLNVVRTDDTVTDQAITRGLRDRVRYVHLTPDGSRHDEEVFVEMIATTIDPRSDKPWVTEFGFSPAARFDFTDPDDWSVLGVGQTLGDEKVLAP